MNPTQLDEVKRQTMQRHRRGDPRGMEEDFWHLLDQSPLLDVVRVKKTGDATSMIEATCRPTSTLATRQELCDEMKRMWEGELRSPLEERLAAHAISGSGDELILEFVTVDIVGQYITGKILVDLRPRKSKRRRPQGDS